MLSDKFYHPFLMDNPYCGICKQVRKHLVISALASEGKIFFVFNKLKTVGTSLPKTFFNLILTAFLNVK